MKLTAQATITMIALAFVTAGCSQETVNSAAKDAAQNTAIVQRESNRAERKLRPVIADAKKQVEPGLQKLDLGVRATAALKLNRNLPSTIRVDADTDGVRLRGSVRTADEKKLAERIVRDTLPPGAGLHNDLSIGNGE